MPLKLHDVTKQFETEALPVEVLRGISFEMQDGEALAITGPSGSGKSTLLHLIGVLEPPTSGRIEIDGEDPTALGEAELAHFRNRSVGFIFQDHHLLPQFSVLENVLLPTLASRTDRAAAPERARKLLQRVGLEHRAEYRPAELSGGERQRAAVARALINGPRLMLCDEPTGSLDARTAEQVSDLLFELHGEAGNLLIVVTHSTALAGRFGRRFELREGLCSEP